MPGPVAESAEDKILKGNPGNRPIKQEPEVTKGAPKPPSDLTGEAFAEWCRIVPELDGAGLLSPVDRGYLVAYCEAWATFCDAREDIAKRGTLIPGRGGDMVRSPAAVVMKDSMDAMLKFGAKFGLSPADRSRLAKVPVEDEPEDDPAAGILS
jgi:P27 family predicted phage terminase small subunit